ncbi:MAG: 6-phosphogluconolactonase [Bacteriovoracaceae bacterium]|nr:6-phosphogluconolactonase [Bacteriovoracaceae bacterium]
MSLYSFSNQKKVIEFANEWCQKNIAQSGAKSLFIPSGNTVIPLYKLWEQEKPDFLNQVRLLQIDEVITGKEKGVFKKFYEEHLPSYAHKIEWIGNEVIKVDLALVGLGLNGHVGFHEPGLPLDFNMGCVKLSETTCKNLKLANPTWGLTYGLGALMNCQKVLMIAWGHNKKDVISKLLKHEVALPATHLITQHLGFDLVYEAIA